MKRFHAYNSVTGLYWTGRTFSGSRREAATLESSELAALRFTYNNVLSEEVL